MKRYFLFLIAAVICISSCKPKNTVGANGVVYTSALDYNNYIVNRQNDIMKDIIEYGKAAQISTDEADKKLDVIINDLTDREKEIEGMPPYHDDSSFRDAAVGLFKFYKTSFSSDFKEMHRLKRKMEAGTITDEEKQQLLGFSDLVGGREKPYDEKLKEVQTKFASDNNIKLTNNTMQDKMDEMKNGK